MTPDSRQPKKRIQDLAILRVAIWAPPSRQSSPAGWLLKLSLPMDLGESGGDAWWPRSSSRLARLSLGWWRRAIEAHDGSLAATRGRGETRPDAGGGRLNPKGQCRSGSSLQLSRATTGPGVQSLSFRPKMPGGISQPAKRLQARGSVCILEDQGAPGGDTRPHGGSGLARRSGAPGFEGARCDETVVDPTARALRLSPAQLDDAPLDPRGRVRGDRR